MAIFKNDVDESANPALADTMLQAGNSVYCNINIKQLTHALRQCEPSRQVLAVGIKSKRVVYGIATALVRAAPTAITKAIMTATPLPSITISLISKSAFIGSSPRILPPFCFSLDAKTCITNRYYLRYYHHVQHLPDARKLCHPGQLRERHTDLCIARSFE